MFLRRIAKGIEPGSSPATPATFPAKVGLRGGGCLPPDVGFRIRILLPLRNGLGKFPQIPFSSSTIDLKQSPQGRRKDRSFRPWLPGDGTGSISRRFEKQVTRGSGL